MPTDRRARCGVGSAFGAMVLVAVALAPGHAVAANGNMPRTPVLYPPHACLTMVDRSIDPMVDFAVHIPFEDVGLTEDELDDSRRVAFVGLCRDHSRIEALPEWVATDDAQRALDADIIDALPPADAVLETAPTWQTDPATGEPCVATITDERVPISCEATVPGALWDTRGVPAGNYVVRSQTFAPPASLWTMRSGVVQIHDGEPLPVATLMSPASDATAYQASGYPVRGCMAGPPGTTVSLQWASTAADLDAADAWTEFAALDACAGEIDVQLALTEEMVYLGLLLRAVATAPDGRTWTGYAPGFVTVYPGSGEADAPDQPVPPDHCAAGDDGLGEPLPDSCVADDSSSGSSGAAEDPSQGGCGCDAKDTPTGGGAPMGVLLAGVAGLVGRRRTGGCRGAVVPQWARR